MIDCPLAIYLSNLIWTFFTTLWLEEHTKIPKPVNKNSCQTLNGTNRNVEFIISNNTITNHPNLLALSNLRRYPNVIFGHSGVDVRVAPGTSGAPRSDPNQPVIGNQRASRIAHAYSLPVAAERTNGGAVDAVSPVPGITIFDRNRGHRQILQGPRILFRPLQVAPATHYGRHRTVLKLRLDSNWLGFSGQGNFCGRLHQRDVVKVLCRDILWVIHDLVHLVKLSAKNAKCARGYEYFRPFFLLGAVSSRDDPTGIKQGSATEMCLVIVAQWHLVWTLTGYYDIPTHNSSDISRWDWKIQVS